MSSTSRPISNVILYNESGVTIGDVTTPLVVSTGSSVSASTYSASSIFGAPNNPTDVFTISGSASTLIKITRLVVVGTQTTGAQRDILIIKRSSANTGGNSSTPTPVPHDSNSSAATAVVRVYSTNPSGLGTAVGTIRSRKLLVAAAAGNSDEFVMQFGDNGVMPIFLRGTSEFLCVNLNSTTSSGNSWSINIEWTEE